MLSFILALKESLRKWRSLLVVVLVLGLSMGGLLVAKTIQHSSEIYLKNQARNLLGADLVMSSLSELSPQKIAIIEKQIPIEAFVDEISLMSMVATDRQVDNRTALVEVRAVGDQYPLLGDLQIGGQNRRASELVEKPSVWIGPEVLAQLGVKVGDTVSIGRLKAEIVGVIEKESAVSSGPMGFAPHIFLAKRYIEPTELIQFGSQVSYRRAFLFKNHQLEEIELAKLKSDLGEQMRKAELSEAEGGTVFLRTPQDATQSLDRFLKYFSRFLAVVLVFIFLLGQVSSYYILQVYVTEQIKNAAIYLTVSGRVSLAYFIYLWQLGFLHFGALGLSWMICQGAVLSLERFLSASLPAGYVLQMNPKDLLVIAGIAGVSTWIYSLPLALKLRSVRVQDLFDGSATKGNDSSKAEGLIKWFIGGFGDVFLVALALFVLFVGIAKWLLKDWMIVSGFALGVLVLFVLAWAGGQVLFRLGYRVFKKRVGEWRLIFTNLQRGRLATQLFFIALSTLCFVLLIVPLLLSSFLNEMSPTEGRMTRPSFLLFNIPDESLPKLRDFVRQRGAELKFESPLILARLMKVNGKEPQDDFFSNFPVRLTSREKLVPSEKIVEGQFFSKPFAANGSEKSSTASGTTQILPEVSLEVKFAEKWNFRLQDVIEFDVQGLPVQARVTSFRKVRWTDFHPNFFVEFQPGVIDDAPKSWIATIDSVSEKPQFQFDLVRNFSELSVVDIDRSTGMIEKLISSLVAPVRSMAWVALLLCGVILASVLTHNFRMRRFEMDIEKLLGANSERIVWLFVREYLILAGFAFLFAATLALAGAYLISTRVLEISLVFAWGPFGAIGLGLFFVVGVTTAIAMQRALSREGILVKNS